MLKASRYSWASFSRAGLEPPRVAVAIAFGLLLVFMWAVSRLEFVPHHGLEVVPAQAISGDEPHYLMVVNSILFDHDLEIGDDYRRVADGGLEAGRLFRGKNLEHHSIIIDTVSGEHFRWRTQAFRWRNPDGSYHPWMITITDHMVPLSQTYEVSTHPIGYPALMVAMIAPFRPDREQVEPYCGLAMVFLGWLGALITYIVAHRMGLGRAYAMVAVATLVLASPWLAYSRSFYSELPSGVALCFGLLAYIVGMPVISAIGVAAAVWMKPTFIVIGAGFAFEMALARRWRALAEFCAVLAVAVVILGCFNYSLARTYVLPPQFDLEPVVHHPPPIELFGSEIPVTPETPLSHLRTELKWPFGHLFAFNYGLLWYAPWAAFAFWALARARLRSDADAYRGAAAAFVPVLLYSLMFTAIGVRFEGFAPGYSYGPRYWIPMLPWLALGFAYLFQRAAYWARWGLASVALAGAIISFPGALRYPHLFEVPFYCALSSGQVTTLR